MFDYHLSHHEKTTGRQARLIVERALMKLLNPTLFLGFRMIRAHARAERARIRNEAATKIQTRYRGIIGRRRWRIMADRRVQEIQEVSCN